MVSDLQKGFTKFKSSIIWGPLLSVAYYIYYGVCVCLENIGVGVGVSGSGSGSGSGTVDGM